MSRKSTIFIILQLITMIYLLIFNSPFVIGLGLIIQILGVAIGIWGILAMRIGNFNIQPEVKSDSLVKSGPYKWIRNPMYTSVLLFYLPIVIQNLNWSNTLVFIVLVSTLLMKIFSEEQFLKERFGVDYSKYKKETKRLLPYIY